MVVAETGMVPWPPAGGARGTFPLPAIDTAGTRANRGTRLESTTTGRFS